MAAGDTGADDPPGRIADHGALGAARLLLAIDGLDDPTGGIPHHLPAALGGRIRGENE